MEKFRVIVFTCSLIAILICFAASVWLYIEGFGMLYMLLFFLALVWQGYSFWNYRKNTPPNQS